MPVAKTLGVFGLPVTVFLVLLVFLASCYWFGLYIKFFGVLLLFYPSCWFFCVLFVFRRAVRRFQKNWAQKSPAK